MCTVIPLPQWSHKTIIIIIISSHLVSTAGWRPSPCSAAQCYLVTLPPNFSVCKMFCDGFCPACFFLLPRLRFPCGFHIVRSCAQLLVIRDTCPAHFHFCLMMIVVGMRIYGGYVYGLHDGEECRNEQQRAINIYQLIVLVYFGKSVGRERMHQGFLSGRQGLSVHRIF